MKKVHCKIKTVQITAYQNIKKNIAIVISVGFLEVL